jgi:ketosteroid isomerase-like protein
MPIHRTLEVLVLCAPVVLACNRGPTRLTDHDRKEMRAVVDRFGQAVLAQDWPKVVSFYSEDGILLPPNGPAVQGRAAMLKLFESWPKLIEFTESIPEIEGRSDLAYVRGTYEMALNPPGAKAPVKDVGKSLAIWQKQGDGSWLVTRVSWNSDLAAAR